MGDKARDLESGSALLPKNRAEDWSLTPLPRVLGCDWCGTAGQEVQARRCRPITPSMVRERAYEKHWSRIFRDSL